MNEDMLVRIKGDTSDFDQAMDRVATAPGKATARFRAGLERINKFMEQSTKKANILSKIQVAPVVDLTDKFSSKLKKVMRGRDELAKFTKIPHTIVINAVDKTRGVIQGITDRLTSPLGLLGAGAGMYGLGKVTLGSAMDFEQQALAMEHWLNGNKKAADAANRWLQDFADKSPFTNQELFPAFTRGIGLSNGDIKMAQRLLDLSTDMAALTPGKSVSDAMEALADAQMGEFERLKEFSMKMTQGEFKKLGGFLGFVAKAEKRFNDGAEKLSQTARGRLSTIVDKTQSLFRAAGQGMLDAMNPRLKRITDWFDNHPATVNRWKERITRTAGQAFDDMLSWGEQFLGRLNQRFNEPGFEKLNWGEKLAIVIDESSQVVLPKAGELGAKLGIEIGKGIISGLAQAAAENPLLAAVLGFLVTPGPLQAKLVVAGIAGAGSLLYLGGKEAGKHLPGSSYYTERMLNDQRAADAALNRPREHYLGRNAATDRAVDIMNKQPLVQGGVLKNARGSILTRPAISLVAEEGPEAIIPLSSKRRQRALELWQETGRRLGVTPYAAGGIIGSITGPVPVLAGVSGNNVAVNVSGIEINITNTNEIDEEALALRIGRQIVREIKKAFENR